MTLLSRLDLEDGPQDIKAWSSAPCGALPVDVATARGAPRDARRTGDTHTHREHDAPLSLRGPAPIAAPRLPSSSSACAPATAPPQA